MVATCPTLPAPTGTRSQQRGLVTEKNQFKTRSNEYIHENREICMSN